MADTNNIQLTSPAPGWCQCGCGGRTKLAPYTNAKRGWVKGQPLRFIHGHNKRKAIHYIEVPSGHMTPCWLWQLAKTNDGYGLLRVAARTALAHRVYYEDRNGPIPDGKQLDHLCCVPGCVNPDHLEAVTAAENVRRGRSTKLTVKEVAEIRMSSGTQRVLARRYGVTQGQISRIRNGKSWRPEPTTAC